MRGKVFRVCVLALAVAMLCGCAHPIPVLHSRTAVISGWSTAQDTSGVAARKALAKAAAITLDHGYRYFEIVSPVRPGTKLTIRLYEAGEAGAASPNVHDAMLLMVNQRPPHEPSPEDGVIDR